MKWVWDRLSHIENYLLLISLPLMLILVFTATVFRYFRLGSFTSAEEASRYIMIWLAFAGINVGIKNDAHLGLSFFVDMLPPERRKVCYCIRFALMALFGCLLSYYTFRVIRTQIKYPQISPGMGIPIWWAYTAVLFGSIMMVVRVCQATLQKFRALKRWDETW
jgi:TRAP-type C4-dicarboxylate transport system permease small subunit